MQIWQLESQNRKKSARGNQDFRILKRLPQTTFKSVENCKNWAKYAILTVWTFLFDQFSTDFDVVYGSVFRIRICRTLMCTLVLKPKQVGPKIAEDFIFDFERECCLVLRSAYRSIKKNELFRQSAKM